MMTEERQDEEIDRFLRLLEGLMRLENLTIRDLERQLDWGKGTLNRIFSGRIELKVRHLLMLADAVGVEPEEFFLLAYKKMPDKTSTAQRVVVGRADLRAAAQPERAPEPQALDTRSLERVMRDMMEKLLEERESPKPAPRRRKIGRRK
jgi:transcriptional regulator with XRE-family HTH domain